MTGNVKYERVKESKSLRKGSRAVKLVHGGPVRTPVDCVRKTLCAFGPNLTWLSFSANCAGSCPKCEWYGGSSVRGFLYTSCHVHDMGTTWAPNFNEFATMIIAGDYT